MPATLDELEEALITADLGVETSAVLVAGGGQGPVRQGGLGRRGARGPGGGRSRASSSRSRGPCRTAARFRPQVVLVCGVNGTGKTTTIGKLASQAQARGSRSCWPPATRSAPPRSSS